MIISIDLNNRLPEGICLLLSLYRKVNYVINCETANLLVDDDSYYLYCDTPVLLNGDEEFVRNYVKEYEKDYIFNGYKEIYEDLLRDKTNYKEEIKKYAENRERKVCFY